MPLYLQYTTNKGQVIRLAKRADTLKEPKGQYTLKLICGDCYGTVYANAEWNRRLGGWECVHCKAVHE